ncbi:hypothetical protein L211DRAFT_222651 [Terfezia boudieri ATCC MYA-4762]|uniref:Uncharacterized protein n=1 Tax=Terfezia boudieri ATCC MYA-4762 TaxID=1051890 RepID=A0A3N4LRD1_9PEZI|nr:hypothetical protein L211DRAFT_222651 [Terfezia boudieri ATCC MYA-4762]
MLEFGREGGVKRRRASKPSSWSTPVSSSLTGSCLCHSNHRMASPPKDVLFGPIQDWGLGHSKLTLEFDGEGGVKKRRQYSLEDVTNWVAIPEFGERG